MGSKGNRKARRGCWWEREGMICSAVWRVDWWWAGWEVEKLSLRSIQFRLHFTQLLSDGAGQVPTGSGDVAL